MKIAKNRLLLLIVSIILGSTGCLSADSSTSDILEKLDESLEHRGDYESEKRTTIQTLQARLATTINEDERYRINAALFRAFSSYQYDSAYVYANRCIDYAVRSGDPDIIVESRCFRTFCLLSAGLYKEACDEVASINASKAAPYYKQYYYSVASRLYYDIADYNHEKPYQDEYIRKGSEYTDSLMQYLDPTDRLRPYYIGMQQMKDYKYDQCVATFKEFLDQPTDDKHTMAVVTSCLGWINLNRKNYDEGIQYLAQAAIYDNETVTKEATALCVLADLLYERGDVERATRYIQLSLEDANFYNARHRKIQIGEVLPIIEQDRYRIMRDQRNAFVAASLAAVALVLILLGGWWIIRKQNRKLRAAHRTIDDRNRSLEQANQQLSQTNEQLQRLNASLQESDKIKDEYIGKSFYINAEYIKKLEKFYKTIDRKIAARQYDDLRSSLKESTLNTERENMYDAFDETFLTLFPDFVAKYNMLFEEKDRKQPEDDRSLTSEMRIFALIRLGITESERIASFLNYSVHTINTYKTRVKNKAIVKNEEFESRIMEI